MAISKFPDAGLSPSDIIRTFGVVLWDRSSGSQVKSFAVAIGPNQYRLTLPDDAISASIGNQQFSQSGLYWIEQASEAHFELTQSGSGWTDADTAGTTASATFGASDTFEKISVADGYFTDGYAVYQSYNFATAASLEGNWQLGTQDTSGVINDANRGTTHAGSFVFWGNDNQNNIRISSDLVTWSSPASPPFLDGADRYGADGDLNGYIIWRCQSGRWAASTDLVTFQNGIAIGAATVGGYGYSPLGGWWFISSSRNVEITTDFVTWSVLFRDDKVNMYKSQSIDGYDLLLGSGGYYLTTDGTQWDRYYVGYTEQEVGPGASITIGASVGSYENIGKLPDGTYIIKDTSGTFGYRYWTTNDLTQPWSMHDIDGIPASVNGGWALLEGGNFYGWYRPDRWIRANAASIFTGDAITTTDVVHQMTLEALPGVPVEGRDGTY